MKRTLLRNFIYDRLYHPTQGYFCRQDLQIGEMARPLDFKKMLGYDDYQRQLTKNYPKNAWLTPSEIFKPYYGMTIAHYIVKAHSKYQQKQQKLKNINIVEAGAGTGSAAGAILHYFKNYERQKYEDLTYTIVELSSVLCKRIKAKLEVQNKNLLERNQIRIVCDDIANYKPKTSDSRVYVMFFEVFDNLPHDKVLLSSSPNTPHLQSMVSLEDNSQQMVEMQDELVQESLQYYLAASKLQTHSKQEELTVRIASKILDIFSKRSKDKNIVYLPTYLLKILKQINKNMPNAHIIASDFDNLPSAIPGVNAPIVSCKGEGSHQKKDFDSCLVDRGAADIFFPTNFQLVRMMYEGVTSRKGLHLKSHEFITQFSREQWAQTRSRFNPFKEDFLNTSFFLTKV